MSTLLLVAIRTNDENIKRRMELVLAVADTFEADTCPSVYAKPVSDLVADDADHLAHFIGWDGLRGLNIGDVVAEPDVSAGRTR